MEEGSENLSAWFQDKGINDLCGVENRRLLSSEEIILEGLPKIRRLYQEMDGPDKEPVSIDVIGCMH